MQDLDIKDILVRFGHWIALAVCICFVGVSLMSGQDAKAERQQKKIGKMMNELRKSMDKAKPPTNTIPQYLPLLTKNWEGVAAAAAAPSHTHIYPSADLVYTHEKAPDQQWINSPENITRRVGRENIILDWDAPPVLLDDESQERTMAKYNGYLLMKRWEDKGKKHQKRLFLPWGKKNYLDRKVETKIKYSYKVLAYTKNTKAQGGKLQKIKIKSKMVPVVTSNFTKEVFGEIKPSFKIKLLGVAGESAVIELQKWEKGDWRKTTCTIKKGQPIEAESLMPNTTDQYINFNPGWTLKQLTTRAKRTRNLTRRELVKENGKPVLNKRGNPQYKLVKFKQPYYTSAIRYLDEKGEIVIIFQKTGKK